MNLSNITHGLCVLYCSVWLSPLFPKLPSESAVKGDSPTCFKRDLLQYLAAYKAHQLTEWQQIIREHDMSSAKCVTAHLA